MPVFTAIVAVAGFLGGIGAGAAGLVGISLATTSVVAVAIGGALIGAAVGAVSAAVQGKSILKGALKGGLIGAAVGGAMGMGAQAIMAKELAASQAVLSSGVAEGEIISAAGAEAAFGAGEAATVAAAETGAVGAAGETVATVASAQASQAAAQTAATKAAEGGMLAGLSTGEKLMLGGGAVKAAGEFFKKGEDDWRIKFLNESAGSYGADFTINTWDAKFDETVFGQGLYQGILADNPTDSNLYTSAVNTQLNVQQPYQQPGQATQPPGTMGQPVQGNQFAPPAGPQPPQGTTIPQPTR